MRNWLTQPPPDNYPAGPNKLAEALDGARKRSLMPPPKLTMSEWADRFAYLSQETSAAHGKFTAFAYQRGIMDAITDPSVEFVTVIKSARVGYTRCLDNLVGFYLHQDPCPILIVQPRVEDAEDYSRTEIAPMIRDTPVLAAIAGDLKAKDSNQRILKRVFPNGASVSFVGANSPGGFRRITARIVAFDEVDGYPVAGAGDEGDQITLGTKRTESFWNRKIIMGSTPTTKLTSRIWKSWEKSDQRRFFVPCPHCGERQALTWSGIRWEPGQPETAHYVCSANGCLIEESDKPFMIEQGEWVASQPFTGHAGFHIWAGYSLFPNAAWAKIVAEFLRVKDDPLLLQTFVNLVLGETWEEDAERVDSHSLMTRLEQWWNPADDEDSTLAPYTVLVVTAGIDVQDDRIEVERVGWGPQEESWSLDHRVLYGDPSSLQLWAELDDYLLTPTKREDGVELPVHAACIDTGGHHTQMVYNFVRDRISRRVYGVKGSSEAGGPVWPKRSSKTNKGRINLFMVGTHAAKDAIYARLKHTEPGPGFCHFPVGRDPEYFDQLTAEAVKTKYIKGFPTRRYEKPPGKRNEALDLRVYAYAGLQALNVRWGHLLAAQDAAFKRRVEAGAGKPPPPLPSLAPPPALATTHTPRGRRIRRSPWMY